MLARDGIGEPVKHEKEHAENTEEHVRGKLLLHGEHNRSMLLARSPYAEREEPQPPILDDYLDEGFRSDMLDELEKCADEWKELLWKKVVLVLLGYEAAETDVVERVESLLGENFDNNNRIRADLGLRRYMALAKNAVAASVIDYMARKTGMSKRQAEILLEKHVEGRKKSDASGSNAGHVRLPGGRSAGIFDE